MDNYDEWRTYIALKVLTTAGTLERHFTLRTQLRVVKAEIMDIVHIPLNWDTFQYYQLVKEGQSLDMAGTVKSAGLQDGDTLMLLLTGAEDI